MCSGARATPPGIIELLNKYTICQDGSSRISALRYTRQRAARAVFPCGARFSSLSVVCASLRRLALCSVGQRPSVHFTGSRPSAFGLAVADGRWLAYLQIRSRLRRTQSATLARRNVRLSASSKVLAIVSVGSCSQM